MRRRSSSRTRLGGAGQPRRRAALGGELAQPAVPLLPLVERVVERVAHAHRSSRSPALYSGGASCGALPRGRRAGAGRRPESGRPRLQTPTRGVPIRSALGALAEPGVLDRDSGRVGIVLVVGRGGDEVVVVARVDGCDPLGAGVVLGEGAAVAALADEAHLVRGVEAPEAVLEERAGGARQADARRPRCRGPSRRRRRGPGRARPTAARRAGSRARARSSGAPGSPPGRLARGPPAGSPRRVRRRRGRPGGLRCGPASRSRPGPRPRRAPAAASPGCDRCRSAPARSRSAR